MRNEAANCCCTKQAKRHVSHLEVRRPESCQWFVIPDGDKILLEQEPHASASCIIHEGSGSALCSPVPMFPSTDFPRTNVPRFPEPMFPGNYVPRYLCSPNLCSPVPMFPDLLQMCWMCVRACARACEGVRTYACMIYHIGYDRTIMKIM